ncbi:hypothetical protein SUGI_0088470 [Cryptomeria japonica]|uniref:scarecrow-like protein 18 n=1 Tax=Cryptomeria japonica TaxID=3369 RepID=UPI002408A650|nr:scarecrow-like protein 18 [Cryptomeria japonica]GLJ08425.1 hypothetical protein SUGI_0088470 [Cryptomeria japonica]
MQRQRTQQNQEDQEEIEKKNSSSSGGYSFFNLLCCSAASFNEMLASSDSHEEEEERAAEEANAFESGRTEPPPPPPPLPPASISELVMEAGEAVAQNDRNRAGRLVAPLTARACARGDATERLACQFVRALCSRMHISSIFGEPSEAAADLETAYLALNQVTPFVRFAHLTANQAILEAINGHEGSIHIVDLNIMQGVQWPPFMQALAERPGGPPSLMKITAAGPELHSLNRTGRRLHRFAQTLGLPFEFVSLPFAEQFTGNIISTPGEALAVNCAFYLHRLLDDNVYSRLRSLLLQIKGLEPRVVTVAEKEMDSNQADFVYRLSQMFAHYSSIFESLEATLPPNSKERFSVEEIWLGREIVNTVSSDTRHQRFERWAQVMNDCGFNSIPHSEFAISQARLLLRLHYPSEGYYLEALNNCFFLGWQNAPLFSVSSWH